LAVILALRLLTMFQNGSNYIENKWLIERTYIHFLDYYHYMRAKEAFKTPDTLIYAEARLAFRFAVLFSEEVILPVSSYFESELARRILHEHAGLVNIGCIKISASESSLEEHLDAKRRQYVYQSPRALFNAYRQDHVVSPPSYRRKPGGSSTMGITQRWHALLNTGRLQEILDPYEEFHFPKGLERVWETVPERLGTRAFIAPHALKILQKEGITQIHQSMLDGVIESSYISGYADALHAGIITDLVYLQSPFEVFVKCPNLSYTYLARMFTAVELHSLISRATIHNLIALKYSTTWSFLADCLLRQFPLSKQMLSFAEDAANILKFGMRSEQSTEASKHTVYTQHQTHRKGTKEYPVIGIITALPVEFAAMKQLLDDIKSLNITGDPNLYVKGTVPALHNENTDARHRVVLTMLKRMGTNSASSAASNLLRSFPTISVVLMVGIACAVPYPEKPEKHVRLGDIVVSDRRGIVQFDNVVRIDGTIECRDAPPPPSAKMLDALNLLEVGQFEDKRPWERYIGTIKEAMPLFSRPQLADDVLIDLNGKQVSHPNDRQRIQEQPRLFRGVIGSSNTLLRDALFRNTLRDKYDLRAIEMEGSGIAEAAWQFGQYYMIVRGTCDYGDGIKNDVWQTYASAVAAAFTRALLEQLRAEELNS